MSNSPDNIPPLPSDAISALQQGHTIEAIKIVRKVRGLQLKEAKDVVDAYVRNQPALQEARNAKRVEAKGAFLKWLLIVGVLGAIAYVLSTR